MPTPRVLLATADGSLTCAHRDTTVCRDCQSIPNVRNVYGAFYLMSDAEYAGMLARLDEDA